MRTSAQGLNGYFSVLIGLFLLVQGFWGIFEPTTFLVFSINLLHAFIHIVLGIMGLYFGLRERAKAYNCFLGILLVSIAIFRFLPGTSQFLIDTLLLNMALTYLNLVIGIMALIFGFLLDRKRTAALA